MTKEMKALIDKYWDKDKHDKIVELILSVPEEERDVDMLGQLVVAYNNLSRFDEAIALSMELKEKSEDNPAWYYRLGYAYTWKFEYATAAEYLEKGIELAEKQGDTGRARNCMELYKLCLPHLDKKKEKVKEEALEIVWSEEKGEYVVTKGVVNLGYFGEFHPIHMSVEFSKYDMEEESIKDLVSESMTETELAKVLTTYFNGRLIEIKRHIVEINQAFLAYLMDDMVGCGYPFWEDCSSYVEEDEMPDEEDLEGAIYSDEVCSGLSALFDKYYETAMNGDVDTTPYVEEFLTEKLPMFNYKGMLQDVYGEYLHLGVRGIAAQCSGSGDAEVLVCAACVEIQNDNSFYDWHNH